MKSFYKNFHLSFFKISKDNFYKNLFIENNTPFRAVFFNTGDYFYFLENLEKRNKLKNNKLRSRLMNNSLQEINQFLKIFKKNGLFYKYLLYISKMMLMHRKLFDNLDKELNETYKNYFAFYLFSRSNLEFYNFNYLLNFVTVAVDPCIQIKVVTLPKFLQKRFKKKFDFQIKHIDPSLRTRYVYKRIILNSEFLPSKSVSKRVYSCLANIFLNPSNNLVINEKIYFYKYALKVYKIGQLNMQSL